MRRAALLLSTMLAWTAGSACGPGGPVPVVGFRFVEGLTRGGDVRARQSFCIDVSSGFSGLQFGMGPVVSFLDVGTTPSATVRVQEPDGDEQTLDWGAADFDDETVKRILVPLEDGTLYSFAGWGERDAVNCFF